MTNETNPKVVLRFEHYEDLHNYEGSLINVLKALSRDPDNYCHLSDRESQELMYGIQAVADTLDSLHSVRTEMELEFPSPVQLKKPS